MKHETLVFLLVLGPCRSSHSYHIPSPSPVSKAIAKGVWGEMKTFQPVFHAFSLVGGHSSEWMKRENTSILWLYKYLASIAVSDKNNLLPGES